MDIITKIMNEHPSIKGINLDHNHIVYFKDGNKYQYGQQFGDDPSLFKNKEYIKEVRNVEKIITKQNHYNGFNNGPIIDNYIKLNINNKPTYFRVRIADFNECKLFVKSPRNPFSMTTIKLKHKPKTMADIHIASISTRNKTTYKELKH